MLLLCGLVHCRLYLSASSVALKSVSELLQLLLPFVAQYFLLLFKMLSGHNPKSHEWESEGSLDVTGVSVPSLCCSIDVFTILVSVSTATCRTHCPLHCSILYEKGF